MKTIVNSFLFIVIAVAFGASVATAQLKPADYKISNVKIVPYSSSTGEFGKEIVKGDDTSFFNELDVSLFVVVELTGEAGSFGSNRMVTLSVKEGKKIKKTETQMVGVINENGKFYIPFWLTRSMCDKVTITAKITGQKTTSTTVRTVPFMCGE